MPRQHDPTLSRRHWVFDRSDVSRIFDVGDSTISSWIQRGLEPVDGKRPQLFAGHTLHHFLNRLRWPHGRTAEKGRLYCEPCSGLKTLAPDSVSVTPLDTGRHQVMGRCTDCHGALKAFVCTRDLPEIQERSFNNPRHTPDVSMGGVSSVTGRSAPSILPETSKTNQRWLYDYRVYLEGHEELEVSSIDEHLRALARMSVHFGHRPFEKIVIRDVLTFKSAMREACDPEDGEALSRSTLIHTLQRCGAFYSWLSKRPGVKLERDLPGYFHLSRKERAAAASDAKGTNLTYDLAFCIFSGMPDSQPLDIRNRAIVAFCICTGIRVAALISLRGKHVNMTTRWVNQDPREVDTKNGKHIRTYCLDLGPGLIEAITQWANWRSQAGFGDNDAFFLPDRHIQANQVGLGYRPASTEPAPCWKSDDPIQKIIKDAVHAAGFSDRKISCHDFRKIAQPFLARRGAMIVSEEVALDLNFGRTPQETIRKHYALISEADREAILDELCRRALSDRSELDLYLAFERGEIPETHPDYRRAQGIYRNNTKPPLLTTPPNEE